jgi:hypothetical protein
MVKDTSVAYCDILSLALLGYQRRLAEITNAIAGIHGRLGHRDPGRPKISTDGLEPPLRKKNMSAAARKRISAATRRRWIAFRAAKMESARPAKAKPKFSLAGLKAMQEGRR